jgi:hypothetical protein
MYIKYCIICPFHRAQCEVARWTREDESLIPCVCKKNVKYPPKAHKCETKTSFCIAFMRFWSCSPHHLLGMVDQQCNVTKHVKVPSRQRAQRGVPFSFQTLNTGSKHGFKRYIWVN